MYKSVLNYVCFLFLTSSVTIYKKNGIDGGNDV